MHSASSFLKYAGFTLILIAALTVPTQAFEKKPNMVYATGEGAMPTTAEQPNRAKAYLQAKGYAKAQAIANLVEAARGTSISYRATGKNYSLEEQISQEIEGMVEHVEVISERKVQIGKDTVVEVTVQSPIPERWRALPSSGAGPAKPAVKSTTGKGSPSWLVASTQPIAPSPSSFRHAKEAPYSSLIIDTVGLGVARSMSPKILHTDGSEIWGTIKVDYDFIADHGIVAYARTMGEAYSNERAGDNPLVLRAVERGPSSYKSDVILSDEDADYLIAENKRARFLRDFRVIFIVDASPY